MLSIFIRIFLFISAILQPTLSLSDRLKDIANLAGVRSNQLVGYG